MTTEFAITELMLLVIAGFSAFITWEFYKSRNGRLRILIIELFLAKIWVYGGAFILYLIVDNMTAWMRLALNVPMFIVMLRLYGYIRGLKHE